MIKKSLGQRVFICTNYHLNFAPQFIVQDEGFCVSGGVEGCFEMNFPQQGQFVENIPIAPD